MQKEVLARLKRYSQIKAKTIQNFPKIIVEPQPSEIVRMIQANGESCRGIISETDGLIVFDSSQYTHASVTLILEDEYQIDLPPKLKPEHQLTFVSTPALGFKKIFIFTSMRAYANPLDELKKYSKVWKKMEKDLAPVYVNFDKYDDVRYLLNTIKDKDELLKELRAVIDLS
jgi:hypothetical protein